MPTFAERVAIVTGGSRGIGRGIALELAKAGVSVIVNYHSSASAAEEVVAAITAAGGKAAAVKADVSNLAEADTLIKAAVDTYGKLDILINNAGVTRDNLIMLMKEEDWDTVLTTNLKSAWNCARAASKVMMRKRYGRIVNITSVVGLTGQAGQSNYAASKAGLIGLTKSLARELAARNITVNAVAPGFITTDMTSTLAAEMKAELDKRILLGRYGSPEDIAYAVAFLAADEASYITGQILTVDGGLVMG
ncbi:MAG TPA: 3-oxoacyl-[acyl-carrier-protein] reductase [Aggregatilineales bacterium]|nr:3-oxoacyl-[acyl-carrier-protein] reductase [Anaerolineales bacterium]HRE49570.1 3-oxoacyl-[acyl-carrier-protein] reductase [Aggregatilineales bacterium]